MNIETKGLQVQVLEREDGGHELRILQTREDGEYIFRFDVLDFVGVGHEPGSCYAMNDEWRLVRHRDAERAHQEHVALRKELLS